MTTQTQITDRASERPAEAHPNLIARVRTAVGLVALAALALFFLQNLQEVEMHFLWFDIETRMLWALLASAAVGALSWWAVGRFARVRRPPQ